MNTATSRRTRGAVRAALSAALSVALVTAFCIPSVVFASDADDALQDPAQEKQVPGDQPSEGHTGDSGLEDEGLGKSAEGQDGLGESDTDGSKAEGQDVLGNGESGDDATVGLDEPSENQQEDGEKADETGAAKGSSDALGAGSSEETADPEGEQASDSQDPAPAEQGTDEKTDTAQPAYTMTKRRITAAPEALDWFYITDDGKALTWEEYDELYMDEESDSYEEDDEIDVEDDYEDFYEDEDEEVSLEDNGWFLDTDDFAWYYYVDEEDEEYGESRIPSAYQKRADDDGVAFGRLHDSDFGGIWYYSRKDGCWHLIDANGTDHKKPSSSLLEKLYEQYADSEDDDEDADDEEDYDDEYEGDEEDVDEDDYDEEDENWESRVVGYGFSSGEEIRYEVTVENTGATPLTLDVAEKPLADPTQPAVGGVYPLDGSGTHPATTMPQDADEEIGYGADYETSSDGDEEQFSAPVCESVTGDDVIWNNSDSSKGTVTPPNITLQPAAKAVLTFAVTVTGSTSNLLSATSADDGHGYTAASEATGTTAAEPGEQPAVEEDATEEPAAQEAQAAQEPQDAQDAQGTEGTQAQETTPAQEADSATESQVQAQQAVVHVPTRDSFAGLDGDLAASKAAASGSSSRSGKAWKRHASHQGNSGQTTSPRTGDAVALAGSALLACAAFVVGGCALARRKFE